MNYTTVRYTLAPRAAILLDIPIDDPYGGPAYGEKLKKGGGGALGMVLGVVAGVATAGIGYAAYGAAMAAAGGSFAAASTGALLSAGAMMAGGVMSAVGAVTGNKKLTQVGGILGLAGGVGGSLITSSGSLASEGAKSLTAEATENALKSVSEAWSSAEKAITGSDAAKQTASLSPNISVNDGVAGANASANQAVQSGSALNAAEQGASVSSLAPGTSVTDPAFGAKIGTEIGGISQGAAQASGAMGTPMATGGALSNAPAASVANAAKTAGTSGGIIGNVMDFAKSQGGGLLLATGFKAVGDGMAGSAQEDLYQQRFDQMAKESDFTMAQKELQNQNANAQFEFLDPSDPMFEQKAAEARKSGKNVIRMGINQSAGPVQPIGTTYQPNVMQPPAVPQNVVNPQGV